ncbi:hypothetical protein QYE76_005505 [Lolium multiflorum]|uniref:Transposase (putative) gypsy type domain-containing protein n=1 Tax=Lolium multiflorum TaxID=4521 RepID=A0AAD8RT43_LOLMU|nr:hypothetical protein QYE76_005505 [Lolium multiflorum]
MAAEDLEWERSKISNQDMNLLKRLGFNKEKETLRFPHEESYPKPPMGYRVSFVDHLIRGLSPPIHEFLRGLLFVYGLQLHQLTPNSILHVSIFITLCECFLGVQPNWALWKRIFCLRRNGSHGVAYNIGGVVICVRSDVDYFDVKFPDSVQGWRKRWLYGHLVLSSLPPLPEGGEVEEQAVVTDDNQGASRPESGVGDSHKSSASLEKEAEAEVSSSTRSSLPAASPKGKRKRGEAIDSGTSKVNTPRARKATLDAEDETLDLYGAALVSSDDEEENAPIDETARTSTSRTLVVSEARPDGDDTSPPPQNLEHPKPTQSPQAPSPKRARVEITKEPTILTGCSSTSLMEEPFMKELVRFGTQFIGYRDYARELEAVTRCSGGDGGVDGGDDDDDDGDDVPLDDDGDGVDFPSGREFPRIPARRRALFSLVFSAPQRRL